MGMLCVTFHIIKHDEMLIMLFTISSFTLCFVYPQVVYEVNKFGTSNHLILKIFSMKLM